MIGGVADTHAALWYLHGNPRLSATAREFIDGTAHAGNSIALSAISFAEIVYLVEKNRLPESAYQDLRAALRATDYVFEEAPVTAEIVEAMRRVGCCSRPPRPHRCRDGDPL